MEVLTTSNFKKVVEGGYCIGCGACAARPTGQVNILMNSFGYYQAQLSPNGLPPEDFSSVCPFSGQSVDEDTIAKELFSADGTHDYAMIGRCIACYAGYVTESPFRELGSSGGLTSWILCEMLCKKLVDGVLHVGPDEGNQLFSYKISKTVAEVRARAKSRYYPVQLSEVLNFVRGLEGRFVVVGVPCFIKAVNLLKRADPVFRERIISTVGIFCGHLKSARFSEYLAAQIGAPLTDIADFNFRHKYSKGPASHYGFEVSKRDGNSVIRPMSEIYGNNWGYGFFKYEACNFCDDVTAETADIAMGDAWLPHFIQDPLGTNVVIVRSAKCNEILIEGLSSGRIHMEEIDAAQVIASQEAGLRDRREGLAYRLAVKDAEGTWHPKKRVVPSNHLSLRRKQIYTLRQKISRATDVAFDEVRRTGSLAVFELNLRPLTDAYDAFYQPTWCERLRLMLGKVARKLGKYLRRIKL